MRCIRCGRFGAKETRVITIWSNTPFKSNFGEYGEWWLVDEKKEHKAGFLRGIPMGPYGKWHAEHGNSDFIVEEYVPLCKKCGEEGSYVLLNGCVSRCDNCGKKRYGAGNSFAHLCESCLEPPEFDFTPCSCLFR